MKNNPEKKPHWLIPIVREKCPACHKGNFFKHRHGYRFSEIGEIHDTCPSCGQRFILEPGFYFGAAYVSYGLNVALMVASTIAVYVLVKETTITHYVVTIIGLNLLLLPVIFRLSRIIWATMFIPFGGEKKESRE